LTVLACRDGVLAADTTEWHGDIRLNDASKVYRLSDGRLFAAYGFKHIIEACAKWLSDGGEQPPDQGEDDFGGIILAPDGVFWVSEKFAIFKQNGPFHAGGAHEEFLYGAMAAGASAVDAVRLAIKYCRDAGGEVMAERLEHSTNTT
jgi:hypothetical protein